MIKEEKLTKKMYSNLAEREWNRLVKDPFHRLEFETTLDSLKKYLPKKGLILDAGGGPGRYTIELAKRGYDVILLDLVSANLKIAEKQIKKSKVQKRVKEIVEGSIINLSKFKNNSFDAVVCLGGPLSHVGSVKARKKAILELIRVAKKNAPIFISVIGKHAVMINTPRYWPQELKMKSNSIKIAKTGDDYRFFGKYFAHFFTLKEFEELFRNKNVKIIDRVGLEGLSSADMEATNKLYKNKKLWNVWLEMNKIMYRHPSIIDTSAHIMIVVKKLLKK